MPPSAPRWPRSPLRTRAAGSGTAVISLPTDLEPALAVARQALQLLRLRLGDAAVAAGDEPVQSRTVTAGPGADRDGRAQTESSAARRSHRRPSRAAGAGGGEKQVLVTPRSAVPLPTTPVVDADPRSRPTVTPVLRPAAGGRGRPEGSGGREPGRGPAARRPPRPNKGTGLPDEKPQVAPLRVAEVLSTQSRTPG